MGETCGYLVIFYHVLNSSSTRGRHRGKNSAGLGTGWRRVEAGALRFGNPLSIEKVFLEFRLPKPCTKSGGEFQACLEGPEVSSLEHADFEKTGK